MSLELKVGIICLIVFLLGVIGWCIIYHKDGDGWFWPIIPIVNIYWQFKKYLSGIMFFVCIGLLIIEAILGIILNKASNLPYNTILLIFGASILCIALLCIINLVLQVKMCEKLSTYHSASVLVCMTLFGPIFVFIFSLFYHPQNTDPQITYATPNPNLNTNNQISQPTQSNIVEGL